MSPLHIVISAETLFHIGNFAFTNSMLTSSIVTILIVLFCLIVHSTYKKEGKPGRVQAIAEMLIEGFQSLCQEITGPNEKTALFAPFVISFFIFILLNNWIGLIPGVGAIGFTHNIESSQVRTTPSPQPKTEFIPYFRAGTSDLNTTIALALVSVAFIEIFGFKALGIKYLKKFFNFSSPIGFFVGILELVLEVAKIVSFSFRLFGNVFAGEVLLMVMMFLVPIIVPMPFYGLEIFVGAIQALVFSLLTLVFFNMATLDHAGEEH